MMTTNPITQPIPSCWTKRVQLSRSAAPSTTGEWQKTLLSFPLVLCCETPPDILPVGEEVALAQSILPELLVAVVFNASGGGILRSRPKTTSSFPTFEIPIGTLCITLDELTKLCSGGELDFSTKFSAPNETFKG